MKKTLDTNILLHDYRVLINDKVEGDFIIPIVVIKEIENHKSDKGEVGFNARKSLKIIDSVIQDESKSGTLPNGKKLSIDVKGWNELNFSDTLNDTLILRSAQRDDSILVTNDVALRIIARSLGVKVNEYDSDEAEISKIGQVETVEVEYPLIDVMYEEGQLAEDSFHPINSGQNTCYILKQDRKSVLARKVGAHYKRIKPPENVSGIDGKNVAQRFYLDMLLDPKIKIIFVSGVAGSGKTLLALAAAIHLSDYGKKFDKIICAKTIETIGSDHGFLPGEIDDKIGPHYASFNDAIKCLMPKSFRDEGMSQIAKDQLNIVYEPIAYMRGRTFHRSFMIFDECQNSGYDELKSCISRAGEGSKVICCGDLHQIDANYTQYDNGLYLAQQKLYNHPEVGIISLPVSERSDIAKIAALM